MAPYLLAGLGNPGDAYEKTRHNAGFMVIDRIANDFSISMKAKSAFGSYVGSGFVENTKVIVAKPMAYMNKSGSPLRRVADYYSITSREMLVVHDDIDLAFGRIKIKEKGGHAGHNGIRSIIEAFGGGDFVRLRVGIGRSEAGIGVADHVLGKFNSEEAAVFDEIVRRAADAAVWVLTKGPKAGMNMFNRKEQSNGGQ